MGRISYSWLHREQSEDGLLLVHPCGGHLAAPRDHVMNPLIVVSDVAHEDGLMMRDAVPQTPNDLEVRIGRGPALRDRLALRRAGKAGAEVRIPDAAVLADREDVFPEREFEFGYDFSGRGQGACAGLQIIRRVISELAFRARQASDKTIVPRPVRAVYAFDRFGDSISNRHFAHLERDDQGRRKVQIPLIERESLLSIVAHGLQVGGETGRRDDGGQFMKLVLREGQF